jgi:hypothetical protein
VVVSPARLFNTNHHELLQEKTTMTVAAKKPQDHLPKAVEDDGEVITEFAYGDRTLTGYGDNVTGESMEALQAGHIHVFLKDLLGQEQWDGIPADPKKGKAEVPGIKKLPLRKLKDVIKAWGDASQSAGNS